MNAPRRVTSQKYTKPYRPRLIAAFNAVGRTLRRIGIVGRRLDGASLMRATVRKTGLVHFGDRSFAGRMDLLIESVGKDARLHPFGRFMVRKNIERFLTNRLRIEDALKRHPEILEIDMEDPVFVVGLQRTGTTMMHRLLASDSARFRFLASWEAINPAPLPGGPDARLRMTATAEKALRYMAPDFFAIHPVGPLDPEEDCLLFDFDFWSTVPEATMRVPGFSRWLEDQDHTEAYRYYKNILRYLYWQNPRGRWVLKTPQHMEHLDELFAVFPGAKIIQTHRDPAKVIASFCSMVSHAYGVFSDEVDPLEIGAHWSRKALKMVNHSIEIRERKGGSFVDVPYEGLMKDPVGQMRRVYTFLGLPFGAEDERRVREWGSANPQHRHGRHAYRLEDFGLARAHVHESFRHYRDRFGIPEEK